MSRFDTAGRFAWMLAVSVSAIVGVVTISEWTFNHIPPSIEAAHTAFVSWMTTPMVSPFDLIGLILVGIMAIAMLMYPMVGPRP